MTILAGKQRRGFASMPSEKQREIASKGGRAAHVKGTAHEWTPDEARSAGRKGARASRDGHGRTPISVESTPESRPAMSGEVTMDSENVP
jgi:general stress protein YciG